MQTEIIGYFKDYYANGKYVGSVECVEKDREVLGYYGRKKEILQSDIIINKKKIRKGTEVTTELQALCGKTMN